MNHESRFTHGFTLVELLVVAAILSLLTGLLVMIVYQFLNIPAWGNAQLAVDSDLRNAGLWVMRDGNEAWQFTTNTEPTYGGFQITRTTGLTATVWYHYDSGTLWRDYKTLTSTTTMGVARHINDVNDVEFNTAGDIVTVALTATSGDVSASRTFTVAMRVD